MVSNVRTYALGCLFFMLFAVLFLSCSETKTEKGSYRDKREALIQADSLRSFEASIVLSPKEQKVNQKLVALRKSMTEEYLQKGFFPPAEPFNNYKAHVEQTKLYSLLRKMPKGGIHHLHGTASVDFRWIVNKAVIEKNCFVFWEESNNDYVKGQLHFFKEGEAPEGFIPVNEKAEDKIFKEELLDLLVFREEPNLDSIDIWDEFESIFARINGFLYYKPIYQQAIQSAVDTLVADEIDHVELRTLFRGAMYDLEHPAGSGYYSPDTVVSMMKAIEANVRERIPHFTLKNIYTFLRFLPEEVVEKEFRTAYQYRKKYPEMIKGFDLVANEDAGHTTLFFLNMWSKMDSLSKLYETDMPLYLHDGESVWSDVQNLYDAHLLESKRIGHGFNLIHFPSLQEAFKENDICIEVSPLSNQILGYVKDLRMHPAKALLRNGVQYSVSSDDPGIFNYNGLSYDFWYITMAWELDLQAIKKLVMNSLIYSSLSDEEKTLALKAWEIKWGMFIDFADNYLE